MVLLASLISWSAFALPSTLSPGAIYVRCHSQFVRRHPAQEDPLLVQVKSGKISPAEACGRLLDEPKFDRKGKIASGRAREIFRTFQEFHSSWFGTRDFSRRGLEATTRLLYDSEEMGYHLTYDLFAGERFDSLVTGHRQMQGVREGRGEPHYGQSLSTQKTPIKTWTILTRYGSLSEWQPQPVRFGELVGVAQKETRAPAWYRRRDGTRFEINPHANYGGGILGLPSYLTLNSNLGPFQPPNAENNHRRWSKAIFSDLLCRLMPAIREKDSQPWVDSHSKIFFQTKAKCMHCHATMDPLADTVTNFMEIRLVPPVRSNLEQVRLVSKEAETKSRPQGRLFYRSYSGELIDKTLGGTEDLGRALAQTDDFYACAASRYFEFMTGIHVPLADFAANESTAVDETHLRYRRFVLELGSLLRRTQNAKSIVRKIAASEFYADDAYGVSHE